MGFILNYDNSILGFLLFQNYAFLAQNTVNTWYMVRSPNSQKQLNEWFGQSQFLYIPCTLKKQVQINLKQDKFNNEWVLYFMRLKYRQVTPTACYSTSVAKLE